MLDAEYLPSLWRAYKLAAMILLESVRGQLWLAHLTRAGRQSIDTSQTPHANESHTSDIPSDANLTHMGQSPWRVSGQSPGLFSVQRMTLLGRPDGGGGARGQFSRLRSPAMVARACEAASPSGTRIRKWS